MASGSLVDNGGVRNPSQPEETQHTGTSSIQNSSRAGDSPPKNEPTLTGHLEVNGKSQRSYESLSEHSRQERSDDHPFLSSNSERHLSSRATAPITIMSPISPLNPPDLSRPSPSPQRSKPPHLPPSSPSRQIYSSSRMHSPASSQIFERDVQEDIVPAQASPAIPSHIMTENHIPPILEASSAALTDDRLDPDSVEIVTHNSHQAASLNVTGGAPTNPSVAPSWHDDLAPQPLGDMEDSSSTYGNLDSTDIRRLSFISFADVVHGEHAESVDHASNRNSVVMGGLSTPPSAPLPHNRSPSPVMSPVSSHGPGTPPPTTVSPGVRGASPNRAVQGPNSPLFNSHSPPFGAVGGELNIETMRQALRRTESGDLGGLRSQPLSAVGSDDRPFK